VLDTDLGGDGRRGAAVVAGEHDDVEPELAQAAHGRRRPGFHGVGGGDQRRRAAVDLDAHQCLAGGEQLVDGGVLGQVDQTAAADDDLVAVDDGTDAVAGHGVELLCRRERKAAFLGGGQQRGGERMFGAALGRRRQPQHLVLRELEPAAYVPRGIGGAGPVVRRA